ncbi:TetR/AcrR family transcriptional regulator [Streptomyces sp. NPDC053367]|uniref:TetR/AcrR family transcriptional regulator n=1 Tax=Streptomyces sp. NPDC053367 TaxID=3365700 RepID=UPI0037CFAD27
MSTEIRRKLLDEAARILAEEGPAALTVRRVVQAAGASTMAVYTHFGSMPALVREAMREGFERFRERLMVAEAAEGDDPVAGLVRLCTTYQEFARAEPDVYAVMLGGSRLAGFEFTEDDRVMGLHVLRIPHAAIKRCMTAGRFREGNSSLLAWQLWCQMHGLAQLEAAGYFVGRHSADETLRGLLRDFAVAAGDRPQAAERSVATAG